MKLTEQQILKQIETRDFGYTQNINKMKEDILYQIFNTFDYNFINYLFTSYHGIDPMQFSDYMLLEFIKYSFDTKAKKYPLRHFLNYSNDSLSQSERMRYQRIIEYTQKYKDWNYNQLVYEKGENPEHYNSLLKKDMSTIDGKLSGYEMSEMNFLK